MAAARGGHSGVLLELLQCGAAEVPIPEGAPTPLQAAVGAGQAEAASLLHGVEAALRVLKLGSGVLSAAVAPDEDHAPGRDGGGSGGDGAAAPNAAPPAGAQPAGSPPPLSHPLLALAADCKVSRSRIVLMDAWEPLLAFSHGAPGFETSLFRCGGHPPAATRFRASPDLVLGVCAQPSPHPLHPGLQPTPFGGKPCTHTPKSLPPPPPQPPGGSNRAWACPSGSPSPTSPTTNSPKAPSAPSTHTAQPASAKL